MQGSIDMVARFLRVLIIICWSSAVFPVWGAGSLVTVAQVGGGDYSSIQAAITAASSNDTVVVLDTAYYDEQVTFDSTKSGMVLRSLHPERAKKPMIRWKDTVHIHPVSCEESQGGVIDYDQNGVLRFLACRNVTVDGIAVDGDAVYPFGARQIWGITPGSPYCMYDLQHGNAAIALLAAGGITIRNCDVTHAYFGIYTKDRNPNGLYAMLRPGEDGYLESSPGSKLGKSGGHVFERNKIHNNSFGMFFESCLDLGSIVRFNCIYENHHPTNAIALYVKNLTSEGSNQPGGALMVKDCLVAPLAIYNNTFWHNSLSIVGGWRPGNQYLQYNNIWAEPNEYWQDGVAGNASFMVIHQLLTNRMYSSVFGAQESKPVRHSYRVSAFDSLAGVAVFDSIVYIMLPAGVIGNMGTVEKGVSSVAIPLSDGTVAIQQLRTEIEGNRIVGTASKIFADTQNVRWVEVQFKSEDPANPDFLVPDWSDTLIQRCVIDKGMAAGGYDADGSLADIGAFSSTASPAPSLSLIPLKAAAITNGAASLQFYLAGADGPMQECTVSYLRFIGVKPNLDGFGGGGLPIPPASMVDIALPVQPITGGENRLSVSVPQLAATFEYAFFEMVVRGVTASGEHVSTVGFIPYRVLKDTILVTGPGMIKAGVPATATLKGTGKYSGGFFKDMQITLLSGMELLDTVKIL